METLRIAAWSGPRNISTAMMRSWENRPDTTVIDEPFYAHYLHETGLDHPGKEDVLSEQERNWERVVEKLLSPCTHKVYYQKQMSHHLLPCMSRDWIFEMTNIFLIRHPREMLTSLMKQLPRPTLEETGLPQQLELFETLVYHGLKPIVIDSKTVLQQPKELLTLLCNKLNIPFYEEMLSWPAGHRESDGVWAPHWYASVEASTGFSPWKEKEELVPTELESLCLECECIYETLEEHILTVRSDDVTNL